MEPHKVHTSGDNLGIGSNITCIARLYVPVSSFNISVTDYAIGAEYTLQLVTPVNNYRCFRRHRKPVYVGGRLPCAVSLHGYGTETCIMESVNKGLISLQSRLATREHHHGLYRRCRNESLHTQDYILGGERLITGEIGIAELTAEVASRQSDKYRSTSRIMPLALQGVENIVYPICPH